VGEQNAGRAGWLARKATGNLEQENATQTELRFLDLACTNAGVAGFQEVNAMRANSICL
jgi:hypothetical protein